MSVSPTSPSASESADAVPMRWQEMLLKAVLTGDEARSCPRRKVTNGGADSGGMSQLVASPGDTFDLDVTITSDAGDGHNSAIFQIIFSAPGLIYESYSWASPYETGSIFDDSSPFISDLPLLLDELTMAGLPYPDGGVDVEMANVVASGTFDEGLLVTLSLFVPLDCQLGSVFIEVLPDTIADGFDVIPTTAGEVFELVVIPVPGAVRPLLAAMVRSCVATPVRSLRASSWSAATQHVMRLRPQQDRRGYRRLP